MRAFLALAIIGAAAAGATGNTYFTGQDAPKCWMHNGRTVVHYEKRHTSFKCSHNAALTECTCQFVHPTHHHGKCQEFDHHDGRSTTTHTIGGDCNASGKNAEYTQWSAWSTCTNACGGGSTTRTRTCNHATSVCQAAGLGDATETKSCNTHVCPVNCVGSWSGYGSCSKNCGGGSQTRRYTVTTAKVGTGSACAYANGATQSQSCNTASCQTCGLYTIAPSSYSTNGMHDHCKTPEYFTTTKDRYRNGGQLYQNAVCLNQLSNGWIQEDLGSVQTVTAVRTAGRPNGGQWVTRYQIMTSTNGNSWTNAGTYTGNSDATTVVTRTLSSPKSARFVRLYVRGYSGYASLRMDVVTCRTPAQSQCGITAGSYSSNGLHSHCATPSYFTTTKDRYAHGGQLYQNAACLNQLSNGWIQEDLGSVRKVTGVRTGGRPNGGQWVTRYQIMTSTNGHSWSNAGTYTGNSDATTIVTRTISPVQARYVRLYVRGYSGYASLRMDVTTC